MNIEFRPGSSPFGGKHALGSTGAEIKHNPNDQNGHELGQDPVAHQTVGPGSRGLTIFEHRIQTGHKDEKDQRKRDGH
jgi:hypothetical protein